MKENVALPSSQVVLPHSPDAEVASSPTDTSAKPLLKRWPVVVGLSGMVICLAALGAAGGAYSKWAGGDLIAPGVAIAGVPVGGLTKSEAQDALQKRFGRLFLSLKTETRPFKVSVHELGGSPSYEPTVAKAYTVARDGNFVDNFLRVYGSKTEGQRYMLPMIWSKGTLVAKLKTIDHLYRTSPKDARLKMGTSGIVVVPETTGKSLNIGETALQIQKKYYVGQSQIAVTTREVEPKIVAASLAGKDIELGFYKTNYNPGVVGRTTNIHVACAAIDGTVLMPGETFSFNGHTGERTFDKGYRMAHIFEKMPGETESEVVEGLAGGVCQVSSTLFNAVRKTISNSEGQSLKIVERNTHSLPVTYVPKGLDATVAWPYKDFRFRNNFAYPVYLRTTVGDAKLRIGIWGRVPDTQGATSDATSSDATSSDPTAADPTTDQTAAAPTTADPTTADPTTADPAASDAPTTATAD